MDLFDDALSEDWISQPGSSGPASVKDDSFTSNAQDTSKGSTRLSGDRTKGPSTGFLESRRTGSARQQSALGEKKASQVNAKLTNIGTRPSKAALLEDASLVSSRSSQSVRRGTVQQHNKSASGSSANQATPEWKRRLLASRSRSSQKDLFSPIDLENVFEAPGHPPNPVAANPKTTSPTLPVAKSGSPVTAMKKIQHDAQMATQESTPPRNIVRGSPRPQKGISSPKPSFLPTRRTQPSSKLVEPKPATTDSVTSGHQNGSSKIVDDGKSREEVCKATTELQSLLESQADIESPDSSSPQDGSLTETQPFVTFNRGNDHSDVTPLDPSFGSSPPPLPSASGMGALANQTDEERSTTPPAESLPSKTKTSPLKLFGKYDTYTNDRLVRRVTQLEDDDFEYDSVEDAVEDTTQGRAHRDSSEALPEYTPRKRRVVSNFGIGELDDYAFDHQDNSGIEFDTTSRDTARSRSTSYARRAPKALAKTTSFPSLNGSADHEKGNQTEERLDLRKEEGKRLLNSPRRIPEPKRRRTSLPTPDSVDGNLDQLPREYYEADHYIAGKKRKDARYDDNSPTASPEVIALRQILRPRIPQGIGRRAASIAKTEAVPAFDTSSDALALVPLRKVADELHLPGDCDPAQGLRKKSVTTADFFKEANLIMRNIRAQAQSPVLLATEDEFSPDASIAYNEEFTMEQLSRPASREGSYRRRPPHGRPLNARVVSHLRKFEETDEADLALGSSLRSEQGIDEGLPILSEGTQSDPPNMRIRQQPRGNGLEEQDNGAAHTINSQSSGQGTDRSVPTASSAGSSAPKATISPDKVSHLLSRTMGSMTFDEAKGCWIKMKAGPAVAESDFNEEDPFGTIPDLTIDESQEILAVRGIFRRPSIDRTKSAPAFLPELGTTPLKGIASLPAEEPSSAISKYTRFTSSGPVVETRATSWADAALLRSKSEYQVGGRTQRNGSVMQARMPTTTEEQPANANTSTSRSSTPTKVPPRWACGSPSAKSDGEIDYDSFSFEPPPAYTTPGPSECQGSGTRTSTIPTHQMERSSEDDEDFANVPFRPSESCLARIPESDDLQLAVTTPRVVSRFDNTILAPSSIDRATIGGLQLTPLPDFTVNQPDESLQLDVGYVAKRHGLFSREAVEGRFSLAIRELVEKIQDVEPHEPYWEFLRKLDLRKRNLMTLHMLNEFCSRVEELDVAGNQLGQLNGAPLSLRVLNVRNNCLSSLTAWHHLPNLQYLNVSGNRITSAKAFTSLVHLRELNVESNNIEDIDEILGMDNLIGLKLAHNSIRKLDFRRANLPRVTSLDVHHNQIEHVYGLTQLSALRDLNLRDNRLEEFYFDRESLPRTLQHLALSNNRLEQADLTDAPSLKSLAVDRNRIQVLDGLNGLPSIETLSWSHQDLSQSGGLQIECCAQVQFLDLSGNSIPQFAPKVPFLNLRRLELASCGLESLGEDFGSYVPNLRVLNLNDNGLKSVASLQGIVLLEELHIVRNRLSRLRQTVGVIRRFAPTLQVLDLRDNPITLAFYPSLRPQRSATNDDDEDGEARECQKCDGCQVTPALQMQPTDEGDDQEYLTRLDEETLIRRRVYEALVLCKCTRLEFWDGMAVERRCAADAKTTKRLLELGVLGKQGHAVTQPGNEASH
jgi:protein NUD1